MASDAIVAFSQQQLKTPQISLSTISPTMPASPSFPSDTGTKWTKRKREPRISRRARHEEEEDEDDEDDQQQQHQFDRYGDSEYPHQLPSNIAVSDSSHSHNESEVLAGRGVRVSQFPMVIRQTVNRPHSSVLAVVALERANLLGEGRTLLENPMFLENVSYGQLQALSTVPADSPVFVQERGVGSTASYVAKPPQILEGSGVVKQFGSRVLVVPMHSDWFSPTTVHRLERQVVPHFFSGKSLDHTPEKYMELRNYIVSKYMVNPKKNLTVSSFQGLVGGVDTEDLARIVRFLNHWGIINYCSAAESREAGNGGSYLTEDSNGELQVPSDALKTLDSLIKFDKPKCRLKATDASSSLSSQNDDDSDLDSKVRECLSEDHCNFCSQTLPIVHYQSQREVDVLLCTDCFHEGKFVIGHSSLDFVKVDSTKEYGESDLESWTDQETLLLLEGVEMYNDNWNDIAEHVGTKTKAQCILHFLRLPVEEGIMENIEVPSMTMPSDSTHKTDNGRLRLNSNGNLAGSSSQDHNSESRLPFANYDNPVMALVAFLASAVGPRVAAACAHASLAALSEDDGLGSSGNGTHMEGSEHDHRLNAPLSAEKVKAAARAGLSAAAMKAKLFADHEEREIQRFSANIINHQLKRLELKLKQFAEIETLLMKDCDQVERTRHRFASERARMISARFGTAGGGTSSMNQPGVAPVTVNNNSAENNRQLLSASRPQPSISGFGNSESVHPNMSFMPPRQSMFGLGPRLPLSAIQSSSPSPTVMFHSPGNPQSAPSHPMMRPVTGNSSDLG